MKKGASRRWWVRSVAREDAVSHRLLCSRSTDAVRSVLDDYSGVAICDGYEAYDTLAREREGSDLTLAHCWAHVRRKLVEAEPHYPEAAEMVERIGQLYAIEAEAKRASPGERLATLRAVRSPGAVTGTPDVSTALGDSDLSTFVSLNTGPPTSTVSVTFTDNFVVNGPGADLVIFELLAPTGFGVQIGAQLLPLVLETAAGPIDGFNQNAVEIDLSDLGLLPGQTINSLLLIDTTAGTPRMSGVAAINSSAEPPRDSRRLHFLRGWSHGTEHQVFLGGPGTGRSDGL